jgi:hypothetical protein
MTTRRLITGATLVGLVVIVCIMAVWGFRAATAPIEDDDVTSATDDGPTCAPEDQTVTEFVRRGEVTVSVYNAGAKSGRAQETMDQLEQAGFKPGEVGNAPEGVTVERATVYTTKDDDPGAELVAKALGKKAQVVRGEDDLGPGVDVMIGPRFKRLDATAPSKIELPKPEVTCSSGTS